MAFSDTHINVASGGYTDHGHQHCLWWQHGPVTATRRTAAEQTINVNMAAQAIYIHLASLKNLGPGRVGSSSLELVKALLLDVLPTPKSALALSNGRMPEMENGSFF